MKEIEVEKRKCNFLGNSVKGEERRKFDANIFRVRRPINAAVEAIRVVTRFIRAIFPFRRPSVMT